MQDEETTKEIRKLNKIFKQIPANKKKLCEGLIQNAAFMAVTLRRLQEDIDENGPVLCQKNGNGFETTMENPAQKSYNTMIGKYTAVIDKLVGLLPDAKSDELSKAGENLAAFIAKGKGGK